MPPDVLPKAGEWMRTHLASVEEANQTTLEAVADRLLQVIASDGLVYTAGTGHSLALVLETFYRAGGLACVYPIYHAALSPFEGGLTSTLLERTPGLAARLLEAAKPSAQDIAFIFSNSGVNPVPVELAQGFRSAGTPVVAVVSLPHLREAPRRADRKLDEVADFILDTRVPYGDAAYPAGDRSTAPLSSLTSIYLWNLLLARLAEKAAGAGASLPLWVSANVEGGEARNRELLARYRPRIPRL